MNRVIGAFGRWFASAGAVWQTAALCAAVVVFEFADPRADPSAFKFLYWATIYSAVTQPVLAYVGMIGARKTDEVLERIEASEARELEMLDRQREMEQRVLDLLEQLAGRNGDGG